MSDGAILFLSSNLLVIWYTIHHISFFANTKFRSTRSAIHRGLHAGRNVATRTGRRAGMSKPRRKSTGATDLVQERCASAHGIQVSAREGLRCGWCHDWTGNEHRRTAYIIDIWQICAHFALIAPATNTRYGRCDWINYAMSVHISLAIRGYWRNTIIAHQIRQTKLHKVHLARTRARVKYLMIYIFQSSAIRTNARMSENIYTFTAEANDNKARFRCEASNIMSQTPLKTEVDVTVMCKLCKFGYIQLFVRKEQKEKH